MPGRGIAWLRRLACGGQPENVGDAVSGIVAGKRALVVGVANKRSIAWAIARRLDEEGARVALTFQGDRVEKDVRKLADELTNGPVPVLPLDVTDDAQLDAAVAGTAEALGGIDILVHAVAFGKVEDLGGRFMEVSDDGFQLALDISSWSLKRLSERVEPHMRQAGGGAIVTLSYVAAERAVPGYNVMGIAKSTLESIVRYLAWDMGPDNVRVNCIAPGLIKTDFAKALWDNPETLERSTKGVPLRRIGEPDELAGAAVYLASKAGSFMTGQALVVDGGATI